MNVSHCLSPLGLLRSVNLSNHRWAGRLIISQIMDPKMDSGFVAPGQTLDDDYDVSRPLLPEEVLGVMDDLLCKEVSQQLHPRHIYAVVLIDCGRWLGTWAVHCLKHYSRLYTLISCYGLSQKRWRKPSSPVRGSTTRPMIH